MSDDGPPAGGTRVYLGSEPPPVIIPLLTGREPLRAHDNPVYLAAYLVKEGMREVDALALGHEVFDAGEAAPYYLRDTDLHPDCEEPSHD